MSLEKRLAQIMADNGDFENFESVDARLPRRISAQFGQMAQIKKAMHENKGSQLATMYNNGSAPDSVATFDIKILRKTTNIDGVLPVPVFGANSFQTKYVTTIGMTGYSVKIKTIALTTDGVGYAYTFTDGVNEDIVELRCNQTPYPTLLESTKTVKFQTNQHKLQIQDPATEGTQFNQSLTLVYSSLFGKMDKNDISLPSFDSEMNFNNRVRTIPAVVNYDSEHMMFIPVIKKANYEVLYNAFVGIYTKTASVL